MFDHEELRADVKRAAKMMDEVKPDWWQHIDPIRFDIVRGTHCVGGLNGLDWNRLANRYYQEGGHGPVFSWKGAERYWLLEVAKRMPVQKPSKTLV